MKRFRVGVIGVGFIGAVHIEQLRRLGNVDVVAVAVHSRPQEKADKLCVPKGYSDYREMIDKENLDCVHICTPNNTHYEMAMYALEHGVNVVCEKPMTTTVEEAAKLRAFAEEKGLINAMNFNCRFYPMAYRMRQMVRSGEAGEYAASKQVTLAVETGPEPVERLVSFIDECGPGIGVNYDPANLVMVTKADEVAGVYAAGSRIVHTHAKDGRCNFYAGPEEVYGIFTEGGIEALNTVSTYFTETPLGEGEVRWDEYLHALAEVGFDGYLTIEREVGRDAAADIRAAVRFLRKKLENL